MARQRMMIRFARWHIWLGWLVGVPLLLWTMSGVVMVARPIEEVRGDHLRIEREPGSSGLEDQVDGHVPGAQHVNGQAALAGSRDATVRKPGYYPSYLPRPMENPFATAKSAGIPA